eukprot:CAMPEP_0113400472 /NCGR_PEP_ID=MMETSP0013_2-20120614/16142_1 /TAXON_ID=2843 ORGANISM="Skeletonema costatum, Strain 1716" /NCGR_SAMPLE_ID=MMETSP0013_2 /ASSEMBLY_ACC=CAM_ASM_000158 /LENGTH=182 /DNA_ID=CAMNT_0000285545 /DNA_START=46 /DNA_END=590 /DNA_ORIENTATION=- /assembly_acc=CAM_ASM_000158
MAINVDPPELIELLRSIFGIEETAYVSSDDEYVPDRPFGPDKNILEHTMRAHMQREISNEDAKAAFLPYCSETEYAFLDNWFPNKEEVNDDKEAAALEAQIQEELANLDIDDVMKALRKSLSTNKRCSRNGCDKFVVNGGVCVSHGAKLKRCSSEGCTNQVVKGGVCMRHGAKVAPKKRCSR